MDRAWNANRCNKRTFWKIQCFHDNRDIDDFFGFFLWMFSSDFSWATTSYDKVLDAFSIAYGRIFVKRELAFEKLFVYWKTPSQTLDIYLKKMYNKYICTFYGARKRGTRYAPSVIPKMASADLWRRLWAGAYYVDPSVRSRESGVQPRLSFLRLSRNG